MLSSHDFLIVRVVLYLLATVNMFNFAALVMSRLWREGFYLWLIFGVYFGVLGIVGSFGAFHSSSAQAFASDFVLTPTLVLLVLFQFVTLWDRTKS